MPTLRLSAGPGIGIPTHTIQKRTVLGGQAPRLVSKHQRYATGEIQRIGGGVRVRGRSENLDARAFQGGYRSRQGGAAEDRNAEQSAGCRSHRLGMEWVDGAVGEHHGGRPCSDRGPDQRARVARIANLGQNDDEVRSCEHVLQDDRRLADEGNGTLGGTGVRDGGHDRFADESDGDPSVFGQADDIVGGPVLDNEDLLHGGPRFDRLTDHPWTLRQERSGLFAMRASQQLAGGLHARVAQARYDVFQEAFSRDRLAT